MPGTGAMQNTSSMSLRCDEETVSWTQEPEQALPRARLRVGSGRRDTCSLSISPERC